MYYKRVDIIHNRVTLRNPRHGSVITGERVTEPGVPTNKRITNIV